MEQIEIEKAAYHEFCALWNSGKFNGQRRGQAFYNHFSLHKLANQDALRNLYQKDGSEAQKTIGQVFRIV